MLVAKNADVEHRVIQSIEGLAIQGEVKMKPMMSGDHMNMLEIHYAAGAGSPTHTHQHESLCYIVRGKARVMVGETSYTLAAGDACRHPENVPHSIEAIEDTLVLEIKSPVQPLEQFLGTGR